MGRRSTNGDRKITPKDEASEGRSSSGAASLEETLALYRAVLSSTLDPIVTIDAYGVIQAASDSVERVLGWKPQELVGQDVSVLMPEPHRSQHGQYLERFRETGASTILGRTREFEAQHRGGTLLPVEISISKVIVAGLEQPFFTGIIHDISERRRSEDELARHRDRLEDLVKQRTAELEATHEQLRLADRLASIGTLAAGLGHDMNNVLLPIRSRLDAFEAEGLSSKLREHLQAIRRSVEYLQHLSDGLHLLALDPESTRSPGGTTEIASWWNEVGPLLNTSVPRTTTLECKLPRGLPPLAVAPHQLTQAVLNLVVNAGEALGSGGHIRIRAEPFADGRFVRLSVSDDGPGMPPDVLRQAMDPFFTTKRRGLGTGLGLSLVRGVATSSGGSVRIESALGAGTTVLLHLPTAAAELEDQVTRSGVQRSALISLENRRIATLLGAFLESAGVAVRYDPEGEPEPGAIWVVEPSTSTKRQIRSFLADSRSRMVVVGVPPEAWSEFPMIVVEDPKNFEQLRAKIGEAVRTQTSKENRDDEDAHPDPLR